jgi:hypothetical protein
MEPYNIAELQTAGVELAHAHNAADADRQRHLALQSGTFLLQLSGLLYDERIISAERCVPRPAYLVFLFYLTLRFPPPFPQAQPRRLGGAFPGGPHSAAHHA